MKSNELLISAQIQSSNSHYPHHKQPYHRMILGYSNNTLAHLDLYRFLAALHSVQWLDLVSTNGVFYCNDYQHMLRLHQSCHSLPLSNRNSSMRGGPFTIKPPAGVFCEILSGGTSHPFCVADITLGHLGIDTFNMTSDQVVHSFC